MKVRVVFLANCERTMACSDARVGWMDSWRSEDSESLLTLQIRARRSRVMGVGVLASRRASLRWGSWAVAAKPSRNRKIRIQISTFRCKWAAADACVNFEADPSR